MATATLAPFSALTALLLLPLGVFGARMWFWRRPLAWLMLGWLVWLPVSLVWSMAPGLSLPQLAVLICLPLGWLAGVTLHRRRELDAMLERLLPWLLLILALWGLWQGPDTSTGKPQGPFNDPNTYAALLNLLLLPLLARYMAADLAARQAWWRTAQLALLAGVAFVLFLTASRGATLALLLVLPFVLWLARSQPAFTRKLLLLTVVTMVAYLAAGVVTSGGSSVVSRLADTVEGGDSARLMLMRSTWLMIQDHPWLGSGLGTFQLVYPQYRYPEEMGSGAGWAHNDYLQLWQEAGLPMASLLLAAVAWVIWAGWRTLQLRDGQALLRMGYIAGIAAILLHALVNFLFYFSLVSMLVGLYLARIECSFTPNSSPRGIIKQARAVLMAVWGYVFVIGYLLFSQVALEAVMGGERYIRHALVNVNMTFPRYEMAYWLSVLVPFHPMPQQVMGLELADGYLMTGGRNILMRDEALARLEAGWQRAPCHLPYGNDALVLLQRGAMDESARTRAKAIVARNLSCDARHGLSYYYAGLLALPHSEAEALEWWHAGLAASPGMGNRLLLATAILSRSTAGHEKELAMLAGRLAESLRSWEAVPGSQADQALWDEAQYELRRLAGKHLLELVYHPTY